MIRYCSIVLYVIGMMLWNRSYSIVLATTTTCLFNSPRRVHSFTSLSQSFSRINRFMVQSYSSSSKSVEEEVLEICQAGIKAVDPKVAIETHLKCPQVGQLQLQELLYHECDFDKVVLITFGKASSRMAVSMTQIIQQAFPSTPLFGHVIAKDHHVTKDEYTTLLSNNIHVSEASHPIPSSVEPARAIWELCQTHASQTTLVVCGISGGGSALFCDPMPGITLQDLQQTSQQLLASGMAIQEMNAIRIQLERSKGGKLAAHAIYPSTLATLVLSDIIGDPLPLIASGPTVPPTTTTDINALLSQYQLHKHQSNALPNTVLDILLQKNTAHDVQNHPMFESQKVTDQNYKLCETRLVGNNAMAVQAAYQYAHNVLKLPSVKILSTMIEGEAKTVAQVLTRMAIHQYNHENDICWVLGGETTVTLNSSHNGKGGRNQELALAAALDMYHQGIRTNGSITVASIGTDGTDGPTDAAGAIISSGRTISPDNLHAAQQALLQHNAYPFLKQQNALIQTGPTGTNVADIIVILIQPNKTPPTTQTL